MISIKKVIHNFFQLVLIQAFGILTPILLTPIILQRVGLEQYGIIATAQSLSVFFILITDFGFNVTAVRKLAQAQQDPETQTVIVQSVITLKLFLLGIACITYCMLINLVPHFSQHSQVYLGSLMLIMGQCLLPIWYFQGTDQLKKTSAPIFFSKLLTIVSMWFWIQNPVDSWLVNLIFGAGTLTSGIILHIPIFKKHSIRFRSFNLNTLWQESRDNIPMFLTNVCTVMYANSTLLLMSFMLDPKLLGLYGLADKILQWIKSGLVLIHNAVYPTLCRLVVEQPKQVMPFLNKTYRLVWLLTFTGAVFFFINAEWLLSVFFHDEMSIPNYFKFLGFIIFMVSLNMPFFQSLLAWKIERPIFWVVFTSSIISISLNLLLVKKFGIPASLWILFGIETGIAFTYFILFRLLKPRLNNHNESTASLA